MAGGFVSGLNFRRSEGGRTVRSYRVCQPNLTGRSGDLSLDAGEVDDLTGRRGLGLLLAGHRGAPLLLLLPFGRGCALLLGVLCHARLVLLGPRVNGVAAVVKRPGVVRNRF